jgi:hypothetical protein
VRAFVDYMKEVSRPGVLWMSDPLAERALAVRHGSSHAELGSSKKNVESGC